MMISAQNMWCNINNLRLANTERLEYSISSKAVEHTIQKDCWAIRETAETNEEARIELKKD